MCSGISLWFSDHCYQLHINVLQYFRYCLTVEFCDSFPLTNIYQVTTMCQGQFQLLEIVVNEIYIQQEYLYTLFYLLYVSKNGSFQTLPDFFGNRQEAHRGFSLLESDLKKQEISICHWSLFDPGHVSLLSDSFFYIHK